MSGLRYRVWMRIIHTRGYHYAPARPMPHPSAVRIGIDGRPIVEHYHWCQWCGLRGRTIDAPAAGACDPTGGRDE